MSHLKDFLQSHPISAFPSLTFTLLRLSHLFSKLTNEEDKEWGGHWQRGEWDTELIRLEKHAGLNSPNEHYKGFKLYLWGFVREVMHDTAGSSVQVRVRMCLCAHVCETHKGEVEVTLGIPCPLFLTVETCLIVTEGR